MSRLNTCPVWGVHYMEYQDEIQVPGPKGSVLILNGAVWHGASANHAERERVALLGFFCRSILKPQQDHLKVVSEEVFSRGTPKLKQLLGLDSMPNTRT